MGEAERIPSGDEDISCLHGYRDPRFVPLGHVPLADLAAPATGKGISLVPRAHPRRDAAAPRDPEPEGRPPADGPKPVEPIPASEREEFLRRVERVMAQDARVRELEEENRALVRAVARLHSENERLKAGAR